MDRSPISADRGNIVASAAAMNPSLTTLLHLASVIDLKQEKIDSALTDERREQLSQQLDIVAQIFQREYAALSTTDPRPSKSENSAAHSQGEAR